MLRILLITTTLAALLAWGTSKAVMLFVGVATGPWAGDVEARYGELNGAGNVQYVCSEPLATLEGATPLVQNYDWTASPNDSECFGGTDQNGFGTNGAGNPHMEAAPAGWGNVQYVLKFDGATSTRLKSVDMRASSSLAIDNDTTEVVIRWVQQFSDDVFQAGGNSWTNGRCNGNDQGLTASSWEYASSTRIQYPANLTTSAYGGQAWETDDAIMVDGTLTGQKNLDITAVDWNTIRTGYTTIDFTAGTISSETYTDVRKGCWSNCPRNKIAEMTWGTETNNQAETAASGSCGKDAAPGDTTAPIQDYNDLWVDAGWESPADVFASGFTIEDCVSVPCTFEWKVQGTDLDGGTNVRWVMRARPLGSDTWNTAISDYADVGGGPGASNNGALIGLSTGDENYTWSGETQICCFMQAYFTGPLGNWIGEPCEALGTC